MTKHALASIGLVASLMLPRAALADAGDEAGADADLPLACDGGLCDTSNGATCDVGAAGGGAGAGGLAIVAAAAALMLSRRRRAAAVAVMLTGAAGVAHADPPGPVDVVLREPPPPRRWVSVAWNPLPALTIGKLSFDVVIAPADHHAVVLSPYYASTTTAPIVLNDASGVPVLQLPQQRFEGFGGEIGYRYYFGNGGLRGVFLGPSFLMGAFTATAQDTTQTHYISYGGALDIGYQMLVADRVALAAGVGAQYTFTDKTIPNQQFPASIYANDGLRPRFLLSVGFAL